MTGRFTRVMGQILFKKGTIEEKEEKYLKMMNDLIQIPNDLRLDYMMANYPIIDSITMFLYAKVIDEKLQNTDPTLPSNFLNKYRDDIGNLAFELTQLAFICLYLAYSLIYLHIENPGRKIILNSAFINKLNEVIGKLNTPFQFRKDSTWKPKLDRINTITTELLGKSLDFGTGVAPPKPQPVKPPPPPPHLSPTVSDGISGDLSVKEKIRILKKHIKESIPKILPENPILHEVTFYSETSKYIYDVFRSWFLESKKGQEWLLKKRKELKSIKNEESYLLTIDLLTDNVTLKQNNIQNSDDGNIISSPVFPGFDGPNTININIHTHPYNQGLHYLKFKTQEKLSYPRLLSMPSYIDIISDFEAALLYYHFAAIIAPNDISFYSWHHDLIMEAVNNQSNPDKQKLLLDVLAHNANEIKSDLVKEEYQKLSIDELIIRLKKRYLNLVDPENDAPIKAIKYEIIKLEALSIQEAAPPTPPTTKPSPEEQAIINSFTPSQRTVYESFLNGCLLRFNVDDAIIMIQKL